MMKSQSRMQTDHSCRDAPGHFDERGVLGLINSRKVIEAPLNLLEMPGLDKPTQMFAGQAMRG
jgi:hypothetical protein